MSQENVETARRAHRAWEADDLEAFLAELHPDVEWHPSIERALEGRATTYHGHKGARRAWSEYRGEAFGRLAVEIDEVRDLGNTVLLLGRFVVTGRTTRIEFGTELGQIFTFRDGKIGSSHDYLSHRETLKAAGLEEWAMSQENVEIVRHVYESGLIDRDPEELLKLATPDIEYVNPPYAVEPGVRRGLVAVAQAMRGFAEVWEESRHELRELYDCGDLVVAAVSWHTRSRGSERELVNEEAHTWTLQEGRIARFEWGQDLGKALEAAGVPD